MTDNSNTFKLTPAETFQLRSELPNAQFNITDAHKQAMNAFRVAVGEASAKAGAIAQGLGPVDPAAFGRFVAGIDLLQQAKNAFCDGVILAAETDNRIADKKRKAATAGVEDIAAKSNRIADEQLKSVMAEPISVSATGAAVAVEIDGDVDADADELSHPPATQPYGDSPNASQIDDEKTQ